MAETMCAAKSHDWLDKPGARFDSVMGKEVWDVKMAKTQDPAGQGPAAPLWLSLQHEHKMKGSEQDVAAC